LYDYNDRNSLGSFNQFLDDTNVAFTCFFIFEAVLKVIARGFVIHPESYLRNGWNLIDSVVVVSGYYIFLLFMFRILELSFGSVKLKALRVVRVFRPLKSINVIPSMKRLIQALIQSLPDFANVGTFLVYVFILFATMGLH
jgi:Ion transport protein